MIFFEKNKKKLKITAAVWMISLLLAGVIYMLVISPQNSRINNMRNKLAEQKETYELAQNASKEQTRIRLAEQINGLRDRLNMFVVDSDDAANLTFDISQLAQEKSVTSLNIEHKSGRTAPEESDSKNNINERHIDISFIAGFNQFAAFLNAIERHRPVLFVNQFTLTRSNQGKSTYQIKMDIAALVKKQQDDKTTAKDTGRITGEKL
jgi:Tfp pilus assembly protein PilO